MRFFYPSIFVRITQKTNNETASNTLMTRAETQAHFPFNACDKPLILFQATTPRTKVVGRETKINKNPAAAYFSPGVV